MIDPFVWNLYDAIAWAKKDDYSFIMGWNKVFYKLYISEDFWHRVGPK